MNWCQHYTLVIPTHNRSKLLRKLVQFLGHKALPTAVKVLDSSRDEEQRENIHLCHHSPLNIEHVTFAPEIPFFEKLLDGLQGVSTQYVSLCADDDIVFPAAVKRCVEHLDCHTECAAAEGYSLFVFEKSPGYDVIELNYGAPSIDGQQPIKRFRQLLSNYQSPFYAVYRTSVLTESLRRAATTTPWCLSELTQAFTSATHGQIHRIECVYNVKGIGPQAQQYRYWHPTDWMNEDPDDFSCGYRRYRDALVEYCREVLPESQGRAATAKAMDILHAVYFCDSLRSLCGFGQIASILGLSSRERNGAVINSPRILLRTNAVRWAEKQYRRGCCMLERIKRVLSSRGVRRVPTGKGTEFGRYELSNKVLRCVGRQSVQDILPDIDLYNTCGHKLTSTSLSLSVTDGA